MRSSKFSAMLFVLLLCGCQSFHSHPGEKQPANAREGNNVNLPTRNNALALLADLLGDEKNVSKILIIKHNSDELGKLIKDISETAGNGAKMIDEFAKSAGGLDLKRQDLPPGEAATRKASA